MRPLLWMRRTSSAVRASAKVCGIARDDVLHEIDLLERLLHLLERGQPGIDPHRPELAADHALPQPRDVGVVRDGPAVQPGAQVERPAAVALAFAQRFRPVVMPVDQRRRLQDVRDAGGVGRRRGGEQHRQRAGEKGSVHRKQPSGIGAHAASGRRSSHYGDITACLPCAHAGASTGDGCRADGCPARRMFAPRPQAGAVPGGRRLRLTVAMLHILSRAPCIREDVGAWTGRPADSARHAAATRMFTHVSITSVPRRTAPAGPSPLIQTSLSAHPLLASSGRRARRIYNDDAHADRRAPPGRDPGRGRTR